MYVFLLADFDQKWTESISRLNIKGHLRSTEEGSTNEGLREKKKTNSQTGHPYQKPGHSDQEHHPRTLPLSAGLLNPSARHFIEQILQKTTLGWRVTPHKKRLRGKKQLQAAQGRTVCSQGSTGRHGAPSLPSLYRH